MKPLPTYENDPDLREIIYTDLTDEKLLNFFFKKGGKVNVNNLTWCVSEYGKKHISQTLVNLESAGYIKSIAPFMYGVTFKARIHRIYKHPSLTFWAVILAAIAVLLTLISLKRD